MAIALGLGATACDDSHGAASSGNQGAAATGSCASRFFLSKSDKHRGPAWIVTPGGLARLMQSGLPAWIMRDFNRPSTLLLVSGGNHVPLAPMATLANYFTSASALERAVLQHRVPYDVRYLLLDLEVWPLTPRNEQVDPIGSLRAAAAVAHSHGKCIVFTPAMDLLGQSLGAAGEWTRLAAFDRQIVRPGSYSTDVFELQSQQVEGTFYATPLARRLVAAVRATRQGEPVLVGLSTNPNGRHVRPADLLTLYRAGEAAGAVGYWLNIPQSGPECPNCGVPETSVAVTFLKALASADWNGWHAALAGP